MGRWPFSRSSRAAARASRAPPLLGAPTQPRLLVRRVSATPRRRRHRRHHRREWHRRRARSRRKSSPPAPRGIHGMARRWGCSSSRCVLARHPCMRPCSIPSAPSPFNTAHPNSPRLYPVPTTQDGPRGGVFLTTHGASAVDRAIDACLERQGARPDFVVLPEGWMNVFGTADLKSNEPLASIAQVAAKVCYGAAWGGQSI